MGNVRRTNGDAKAFRRKQDGRWATFIEVEPQWVAGKRKRRRISIYGKSERECIQNREEAKRRLTLGTLSPGEIPTLAYFLEKVYLPHVESRLRPSTARNYRHRALHMLVPKLGHRLMSEITPQMLEAALAAWKTAGYDDHTRTGARAVLSGAYTYARDALPEVVLSSPIRKSNAVQIKSTRKNYILGEADPKEPERFIAACLQVPYGVAYLIEALLGPRGGEVWALTTDDIDEAEGTIRIDTQIQYVPLAKPRHYSTNRPIKNRLEHVKLKTKASSGTLDAPAIIFEALRTIHRKDVNARRLRAGSRWVEQKLLFPNETGGPLSSSWATREVFHNICELAGVPHSTSERWGLVPHDLRHSAVRMMLEDGIPLETISKIVRHSRYSTTLDLYGSWVKKAHRKAAQKMQARFGRLLRPA